MDNINLSKKEFEEQEQKQKGMQARRKRKIPVFNVTFNKDGTILSHNSFSNDKYNNYSVHSYPPSHFVPYSWEPNSIFTDELIYAGYFSSTRGNSHIKFNSTITNRQYHMFMSDFDEVIEEQKFIDNKISGKFYFCRKGSAQGIRLVFE